MGMQHKHLVLGVRGRLLLAFLAISMFSLAAAASGIFSFAQSDAALSQITEVRVPQALSWLELSRQAERVVRAAPALLVVTSEQARTKVSAEITSEAEQLNKLLRRIRDQAGEDQEEGTLLSVIPLVENLTDNLIGLDDLVKKRLSIVARRNKHIRQLGQANKIAQRALSPGARILGAQIVDWNRNVRPRAPPRQQHPVPDRLRGL